MLEMRNRWKQEYEKTLRFLGSPAEVIKKDGTKTSTLVGINSKPSDEIVNAYGVNVKVITVLIDDVPELEKFDRILLDNEVHTIDDIRTNRINDLNVSHICICRGK
jgi:hypothetical protein